MSIGYYLGAELNSSVDFDISKRSAYQRSQLNVLRSIIWRIWVQIPKSHASTTMNIYFNHKVAHSHSKGFACQLPPFNFNQRRLPGLHKCLSLKINSSKSSPNGQSTKRPLLYVFRVNKVQIKSTMS